MNYKYFNFILAINIVLSLFNAPLFGGEQTVMAETVVAQVVVPTTQRFMEYLKNVTIVLNTADQLSEKKEFRLDHIAKTAVLMLKSDELFGRGAFAQMPALKIQFYAIFNNDDSMVWPTPALVRALREALDDYEKDIIESCASVFSTSDLDCEAGATIKALHDELMNHVLVDDFFDFSILDNVVDMVVARPTEFAKTHPYITAVGAGALLLALGSICCLPRDIESVGPDALDSEEGDEDSATEEAEDTLMPISRSKPVKQTAKERSIQDWMSQVVAPEVGEDELLESSDEDIVTPEDQKISKKQRTSTSKSAAKSFKKSTTVKVKKVANSKTVASKPIAKKSKGSRVRVERELFPAVVKPVDKKTKKAPKPIVPSVEGLAKNTVVSVLPPKALAPVPKKTKKSPDSKPAIKLPVTPVIVKAGKKTVAPVVGTSGKILAPKPAPKKVLAGIKPKLPVSKPPTKTPAPPVNFGAGKKAVAPVRDEGDADMAEDGPAPLLSALSITVSNPEGTKSSASTMAKAPSPKRSPKPSIKTPSSSGDSEAGKKPVAPTGDPGVSNTGPVVVPVPSVKKDEPEIKPGWFSNPLKWNWHLPGRGDGKTQRMIALQNRKI